MEIVDRLLITLGWSFLVLGVLTYVLAVIGHSAYQNSIEKMADAIKGRRRSYQPAFNFGLILILFGVVFLLVAKFVIY